MSKQNPRIEAQRQVLQRLTDMEFDTDSYDGTFVDDNWKPSFHYYQGVERFRKVALEMLWELDKQEKTWRHKADTR